MRNTLSGRFAALIIAAVTAVLGCSKSSSSSPPPAPTPPATTIMLQEIATGFDRPVHLSAPVGDSRLFIVEQAGRVWIIDAGVVLPTPFLDISSQVESGGERGLLGLAFHPDYATNGRFFVNYTHTDGASKLEEYSVSSDPNVADASPDVLLLSIPQPFANHNGGHVEFGPDGMLYSGFGDGGSGGDPDGNGQDLNTLLGTIVRLDVDGTPPYEIPPDNPFAGPTPGLDEIWIYGLRNPWRFAFDDVSSQLFIADVGQNTYEEVSVVSSLTGGHNLGWVIMEGPDCFTGPGCDMTNLVLPAVSMPNPSDGCSVIGGYVYRGTAIPEVQGHYFYSDLCRGWLRSFRMDGGSVVDETEWDVGILAQPFSFGLDGEGELYLVGGDGRVLKMVPSS